MAGIYIHIPFCKTKCHYCNFFSMASDKLKPQFISILNKEIHLQKDYLANKQINTIYLGGGTPSLFNARELSGILEEIYATFNVSDDVEITLEANPDDVSESWVKQICQTGINRVSLGVQSFFDEDLAYLKRVHNAADAEGAIHRLQDTGISNISIDLIYGIPTLNNEKWIGNLEKFFSFDIPHLSAYALTVEDKTALHVLIEKKKIISPDDDMIAEQFSKLLSMTTEKGYIHYEISNFALEGFYSKHNSLYWTGGHYLGLGPSAHSYNGSSRRWNKPSMKAWLSLLEYYGESFEEEILSTDQRYNEYVMTSLRTVWGCDIDLVRQEFGEQYASNLLSGANKYIVEESLVLKGNRLFLTTKGKLFADGIASGLFA
ncbi:MAG: radical SAM family heme chaperone HemW [Bacteroidetes bacterium]|nr:radical SAM family heme chaperone HemW [Bacteroidota bacterium]